MNEYDNLYQQPCEFIDTNEIMQTKYPPPMWVVPGYLPAGFSVLAGRQKLGKTWMALDFGVAVACGGCALGSIKCEAGDVLYVDMENGLSRIQRRLETIFQRGNLPDLNRLKWFTDTAPLNSNFLQIAQKWKNSVPHPRLLIIDVLQRIKPPPVSNKLNAYESDYGTYTPLHSWAQKNHVAVLGLHHTRKGGANDPLEALNGSNGLSAVADTTLVLDRNQHGTTLYVRGRDVEEKESALKFTNGVWTMLGVAAEVFRSSERIALATALEGAVEPKTPTELAEATGMKPANARKLLRSMLKSNEVGKVDYGKYVHPRNQTGTV